MLSNWPNWMLMICRKIQVTSTPWFSLPKPPETNHRECFIQQLVYPLSGGQKGTKWHVTNALHHIHIAHFVWHLKQLSICNWKCWKASTMTHLQIVSLLLSLLSYVSLKGRARRQEVDKASVLLVLGKWSVAKSWRIPVLLLESLIQCTAYSPSPEVGINWLSCQTMTIFWDHAFNNSC